MTRVMVEDDSRCVYEVMRPGNAVFGIPLRGSNRIGDGTEWIWFVNNPEGDLSGLTRGCRSPIGDGSIVWQVRLYPPGLSTEFPGCLLWRPPGPNSGELLRSHLNRRFGDRCCRTPLGLHGPQTLLL